MNKKLNFARPVLLMAFFVFGFQLNAQEKVIPQAELPKSASDFVQTHFSDQKIVQVIKDVDFLIKTEYEVLLDNGFQLEFDNNGNWKDIDGNHSVIPTGFISESVTSYVGENFPTAKVSGISKKRSGYELELTNDLELEFDSNGTFVRIDD